MKKHCFLWFGFILLAVSITGCQLFTSRQQTTLPSEEPVSTATQVIPSSEEYVATETQVAFPSEEPVPTATEEQIALPEQAILPYKWPVPPLTEEQIAAAKACDIETLSSERYADANSPDELQSAFTPETDCDWAVLAYAYASQVDPEGTLPEPALDAFFQAISHNFGYAFATPIFYQYFGKLEIAEPPAFTQQPITKVQIHYVWGGYGDPVEYTLEITQANATPSLTVKPDDFTASLSNGVDSELIQSLALALTDLLPVETWFDLIVCVDNYPYWDVTLTFEDGTTLNLITTSNFLFFGGPWFTEIDGQKYMQYSADFADAVSALIESTGLPIGEPAGMYCFGGEVFELAFP